MDLLVAIPFGVAAAAAFAVSSVLQQRVAREAPQSESLSWRLLADLIRRKSWLAGSASMLVAFGLESVALAFGPIGVVEPLVTTELVFALPLGMGLRHRRPGPRELLGAAMVVAGVAMFLAVASPSGGRTHPGYGPWIAVAVPVAALVGGAVFLARGPERPTRAVLLAVAAALSAGFMALVTQSFVRLFADQGFGATLTSWQPYALIGLGVFSMTVAQSAFQSAPLAISLPIIDALEPVTSVLMAVGVFDQRLSSDGFSLACEAAGAVLAIVGIWTLTRSPLVLGMYEQQQRRKDERRATASV